MKAKKNLLLIQGPNMRYLGRRMPQLYGATTAAELDKTCSDQADKLGYALSIFYSSSEGAVIDRIYDDLDGGRLDGLLMNPASFIHNGHGLRACVQAIPVPYIEIHMTNIEARGFKSLLAPFAKGVVLGFGVDSYRMAIEQMDRLLSGNALAVVDAPTAIS